MRSLYWNPNAHTLSATQDNHQHQTPQILLRLLTVFKGFLALVMSQTIWKKIWSHWGLMMVNPVFCGSLLFALNQLWLKRRNHLCITNQKENAVNPKRLNGLFKERPLHAVMKIRWQINLAGVIWTILLFGIHSSEASKVEQTSLHAASWLQVAIWQDLPKMTVHQNAEFGWNGNFNLSTTHPEFWKLDVEFWRYLVFGVWKKRHFGVKIGSWKMSSNESATV